jgi:hypothetical protein
MKLRRSLLSAWLATAVVAAVPAPASAVSVRPFGIAATPVDLTLVGDRVYVAEPSRTALEVLARTGDHLHDVGLPGVPRAVMPGPGGQVLATIGGPYHGIAMYRGDAIVPIAYSGMACGPVAAAFDERTGWAMYTSPDDGTGCSTYGVGGARIVGWNEPGVGGWGAFTENPAGLLLVGDEAFVSYPETGEVVRYRDPLGTRTLTRDGTFALPPDSGPGDLALGPDGQVWVALTGTGQVARFPADAADGTAPVIVASGLDHPVGLHASVSDQSMWVASSGDGRAVRVAQDGSTTSVPLPPGFRPWRFATIDDATTWVIDRDGARIARLVDGAPTADPAIRIDGATASLAVDPRGNDAHVTWIADGSPAGPRVEYDGGTVADAGGPATVRQALGGLPAGRYAVTAVVTSARGELRVAAPSAYVVPVPPAVVPPRPRRPVVADILSLRSAARCVVGRTLTITVHRRRRAGVASVAVRVGQGRTRTYASAALRRPIHLRGLPARGRYRVRVTVTMADTAGATATRTYHACAPKPAKRRRHTDRG